MAVVTRWIRASRSNVQHSERLFWEIGGPTMARGWPTDGDFRDGDDRLTGVESLHTLAISGLVGKEWT